MRRSFVCALALLLALAGVAGAQSASGNIYGTVTDESGAVLPGATVNLTGATIGARSTQAGNQGDFRFLRLDPGTYKLSVTLNGFSTVNREVLVSTGANVDLAFALKVASVEETVTVTAETPIVDTKKTGTGVTLSKEELHQVPTSRDPWAVLRTIPGVIVDRVNIAGNESGQQSNFTGKGTLDDESTWTLDGVTITDMSALGGSPDYYDYDAFEEINVGTGAADLKMATGGVGLNFVTKRGTNSFHGSLRGYFTHDDLQWSNIPDELRQDPRLQGSDKADHIQQIADYGMDLGGPILKDKLWFWGSFGKQDIRLVRTNQTADKTILKDYNAKLNWQATPSDMVSVFWFKGEKIKEGRAPGFPGIGSFEDDFLWNQGNEFPGTIPGLFKVEANHVFGPSFVLNAKYAHYNTGFGFTPRGGVENPGTLDYGTGTGRGSSPFYATERPQDVVNVDANYFRTGWGGTHELKFGFGYRKTPVTSSSGYGGPDQMLGINNGPGQANFAWVSRNSVKAFGNDYWSAYVGDTFTRNRVTVNVGLRFDQQKGSNEASSAPANPAFPNLLPALEYAGGGQGVDWKDISPRVGLTYALDEARKTVVRASYARYAGQLGTSVATWDNPLGSISFLAYLWDDLDGDGFAQANEVLLDQGIQYYAFVDPANPTAVSSVNTIDPDLESNKDDEFIVGIDRELFPNFAVSAAYTYRKSSGIPWQPRIGLTTADYTADAPITRNGYTVQTFSPDPDKVAESAGGRTYVNRPDYSRSFGGFELSLIKRMSNKWMSRVAFTFNDWTENYEGPGAIQNPTRTDETFQTGNLSYAGPLADNGQFAPRSGGSGKGDIFVGGRWQLSASALYQLPAGFEVAASLFGREGHPRPIVIAASPSLEPQLRVLATPTLDTERYPSLWDLDLRLSKTMHLAGATSLVLTADLFNVFNSNTELNRNRTASSSVFNRLDEVLSPRVARFGVRLTF